MKKLFFACIGVAVSGAVAAEDVTGVARMICASGQAHICLETGECYATTPWELSVPDFVANATAVPNRTKSSGRIVDRGEFIDSVSI